jgi:hypothetical protein
MVLNFGLFQFCVFFGVQRSPFSKMKFYQPFEKHEKVENISTAEMTNLSPFIFRLRFYYDLLKTEALAD